MVDMEKPCLFGLDSVSDLFRKTACDDLGRMKKQVRGEAAPLIHEAAAKQVENPRCRGGETGAVMPGREGRWGGKRY